MPRGNSLHGPSHDGRPNAFRLPGQWRHLPGQHMQAIHKFPGPRPAYAPVGSSERCQLCGKGRDPLIRYRSGRSEPLILTPLPLSGKGRPLRFGMSAPKPTPFSTETPVVAAAFEEALAYQMAHGLSNFTPIDAKSLALRVTTVIPCTRAVAAMRASRSALGSGTCRWAQRLATTVSTGRIRSANSGRTWLSSQMRKALPCFESLRSTSRTPNSNSSTVIAEM